MRWRVLVELTGPDGNVGIEEVIGGGRSSVDHLTEKTIGLTLAGVGGASVRKRTVAYYTQC
jgi:hypothetical protein